MTDQELNLAVAEAAGYCKPSIVSCVGCVYIVAEHPANATDRYLGDDGNEYKVFRPSTDWNDAMEAFGLLPYLRQAEVSSAVARRTKCKNMMCSLPELWRRGPRLLCEEIAAKKGGK